MIKFIVLMLLCSLFVVPTVEISLDDPVPVVAFIGDSLTLGESSTGYKGFAGMVSQAQGWDEHRFVWYHLADVIVRWEQISIINPDIIVIELGVHAVVGCDHLVKQNGAQFQLWYSQVLNLAQNETPAVYAVNIPWLNWGDATPWAMWYNSKIEAAALKHGVIVIDAWSVTVNCTECISDDGFHLNDLGHQRIADEIIHVLENEEGIK